MRYKSRHSDFQRNEGERHYKCVESSQVTSSKQLHKHPQMGSMLDGEGVGDVLPKAMTPQSAYRSTSRCASRFKYQESVDASKDTGNKIAGARRGATGMVG